MTIVAKNRLTPKRFLSILLVILIVLAVAVPVTLYWTLERNETHLIWDINSRYAQQFFFHTDWAAALMRGNINPWNNQTAYDALNELAYADFELNGVSVLDQAHANQLYQISNAIETIRTPNGTQLYIQSLSQSARILLANQVSLLGHDVVNAYWNFINYTSSGNGVGPPFWYNGPSPPDENLIQNAVNIALAFERK